jgi:uncharacterized protein (TIGR02996 family)
VSEGEAVIGAIVAQPGDDLPRPVYADWLDDRGDPRGEYIRAEHRTVARTRERGFELGWYLGITGLAETLDPVWVARVTRPPLGVCCGSRQFTGGGRAFELDWFYDIRFADGVPAGFVYGPRIPDSPLELLAPPEPELTDQPAGGVFDRLRGRRHSAGLPVAAPAPVRGVPLAVGYTGRSAVCYPSGGVRPVSPDRRRARLRHDPSRLVSPMADVPNPAR